MSKTISLKTARLIDSRLTAKLKTSLATSHTINVYSEDAPAEWLNTKQAATANAISRRIQLLDVKQNLRNAIQSANERSGINQLLGLRKTLLDKIQVWKTITNTVEHDDTFPINARMLNSIKDARKASVSYGSETVTVCTVDQSLVEHVAVELRSLRNQLDVVEEKLASLNAKTELEFDDQSVFEILKQEGIFG